MKSRYYEDELLPTYLVGVLQFILLEENIMNISKPLVVMSLTMLTTLFTMNGLADDDAGKDDAVKAKGRPFSSRVKGCALKVATPDVILYSNRSLQGIPIAKVPAGDYQPLDYRPGWYKIRAQGWDAWIQDPSAGRRKTALQKKSCPGKNNHGSQKT